MPANFRAIAALAMALHCIFSVEGAKTRSWVGPDTFFEGDLPVMRYGHGFTCADDGRIYLFGGIGETGKVTKRYPVCCSYWVPCIHFPSVANPTLMIHTPEVKRLTAF